MTGGVA